jgi:hypothetical protein
MNAPTRTPESTALTTAVEPPAYRLAAPTGRDLILHAENLNAIVRVAEMMAKSRGAVPKHLRDNPGGCMAVTMQAMRWNMDPFALAVKTYQIDDNPIAYEGQAVIAALNNSPLLVTRLSFRWDGPWERIVGRFKQVESKTKKDSEGNPKKFIVPDWDFNKDEEGLSVTVWATLVDEPAPRELTLLMKQARVRNSPLWAEDPKQQIAYLAGRRWGRLHAPDVIMGVFTPDELEELPRNMGEADVVREKVDPALLARAETAAAKGRAAYQEFWKHCTHGERAILSEQTDHHERLKNVAAAADDKRTVSAGPPPAPTPAPTPGPTAAPVDSQTSADQAGGDFKPTFANVYERMKKASEEKNAIALDIAGDWIGEIEDPQQRKELTGHYETFKAAIAAGSQQ